MLGWQPLQSGQFAALMFVLVSGKWMPGHARKPKCSRTVRLRVLASNYNWRCQRGQCRSPFINAFNVSLRLWCCNCGNVGNGGRPGERAANATNKETITRCSCHWCSAWWWRRWHTGDVSTENRIRNVVMQLYRKDTKATRRTIYLMSKWSRLKVYMGWVYVCEGVCVAFAVLNMRNVDCCGR